MGNCLLTQSDNGSEQDIRFGPSYSLYSGHCRLLVKLPLGECTGSKRVMAHVRQLPRKMQVVLSAFVCASFESLLLRFPAEIEIRRVAAFAAGRTPT